MSDARIPFIIGYWQEKLQIKHCQVIFQRISPMQVCNDVLQRGQEFIGISTVHKNCTACLYSTRKLQTADIIHKLLHVKMPEWSEAHVNIGMYRLLAQMRHAKMVYSD